MIGYIKGIVEYVGNDKIVLENGGIGYNIFVPASLLSGISKKNTEIKLFTYLSVKEDSMTLYGFLSNEELELFKNIINVSGIGPKGGLNILSTLSPAKLKLAVMAGDENAIAKSPGIGKKTASKLIIELKDKLDIADTLESEFEDVDVSTDTSAMEDAIAGLIALGYSESVSLMAVRKAVKENKDKDFDNPGKLIKESLKYVK